MTTLLQTLEPMWEWLLRVSGQAAVLVLLILLVQAIGRERISARWRYALWLLLVIRLALPVQVPSRFSVFNLAQFRSRTTLAERAHPEVREVAASHQRRDIAQRRTEADTKAGGRGQGPAVLGAQQREAAAGAAAVARGTWLPLLWMAGAAMLVMRILIQNLLFYRRLRWEPSVTDGHAWQTMEQCRQLMGVQYRLVLVETDLVHSPSLYGFVRLHLLLPKNTLSTLTAEELRFVFLHELAHVKRRDMLVNWAMTVLQVLHWFNPMVWLGFRLMALEREIAADALALSYVQPRENVAYGNAILKLLQALIRPAVLPGLIGILENRNQMRRRFTMIAKFSKTSSWPIPAALAFAAIALLALTDPSAGSDRRPLTLSGKPAADLAVLRVWSCTNEEFSMPGSCSADGKFVSYTDPQTGGLMVRDLIKRKSQLVVKVADPWKQFATASAVSPDAAHIAYGWYGKYGRTGAIQLRIIGRDGKGDRVLYENASVAWGEPACWSADGQQLVASFQMARGVGSNQLVLITVRDGSFRVIRSFAWDYPGGVCLDPSGRFLAYHIRPSSALPEHEVRLISLQGSEDTLLLGGPSDNTCLGWSPDGRQLLFTSNRRSTIDCWVQRMEDGNPQGAPELLKADIGPATPMGITRSGGLYYRTEASVSEVKIATVDPNSGEFVSDPKPLTGKYRGHEAQPHWSPNGKQLAYLSRGMLCVRTLDTGEEREYAPKIGDFHMPAWGADGKSIRVTTSHVNEQPGTFRVDLATGEAQRVNQGGFFLFPAKDETVAFRRVFQEPQQIQSRNLQTGEEKVLYKLEGEAFGGGWMLSPDAKYLAFGTCRGENSGWENMVKCVAASGGEVRELLSSTNGCSGIAWFPDSHRILVRCGKEFWVLSIDGKLPQKLITSLDASEPSIHPSGRQIAFQTRTTRSEIWLMENAAPALGKAIPAARR